MTKDERSVRSSLGALGYDAREVSIYLALLELGEATAQTIATKARLERTGVYDVLRRLRQAGLVSEVIRGGIRRYLAEPPRRLEEGLSEQLEKVRAIIPILESRYNRHPTKPVIRFYEGIEGLKTVLEDTLTSPDQRLVGILSMHDLFDVIGEEAMEAYVRRRIEARVNLRVIRSQQKDVDERWPTSKNARRELRYAPAGKVFAMNTYVYGNKVALLSTRQENFGMIIESDEFATHQRHLFEALWQISKPVPEQK